MSQWTHVAGLIRVDGGGPIVGLGKIDEMIMLEQAFKESPLPTGSEGPLQYEVRHHGFDEPGVHSANRADICIWGDLRDFDEPDCLRIISWLEWIANKFAEPPKGSLKFPFWIRNAVISIEPEDHPVMVYLHTEKGFQEVRCLA